MSIRIQRPGQKHITIGNPGLSIVSPRGGVAAWTPTTVVVSDTFTDTDATALTAHTPNTYPVGSVWVAHNASYPYAITSNQVYGNATTAFHAHVIESGAADVQIDVEMATTYYTGATVLRQPGIVFRYASGTFLLALANYYSSQIQIVDSSQNILAYTAWASRKQATLYSARVVVSGTSITATIDGNTVSTTSTINQTATMHGIEIYPATAYMDNFVITA